MKRVLLLCFLVFLVFSYGVSQNLVHNGNFESWDSENKPTDWSIVESISPETTIKHGDSHSAKHVGGTKKLGQVIEVTPGQTYKLQMWYYVAAGDKTDARIWSYWRNTGTNLDDNTNELRGPNNLYFNADPSNPSWQKYEVVVSAPATANEFYLELRTYKNAIVYWDDISLEAYTASASNVVIPEFSEAAGTYSEPVDITITSATPDAAIYYTTDGSTPTDASTLYESPINVSTTTTLKAIAYKAGMTESAVATATYSFPVAVTTIAELRSHVADGGVYQLTGEVVLTHQQASRNQKLIQDVTGGILVDDPTGKITSSYNLQDGITGLMGTLTAYRGLLQFIPVADAGGASSSNNVVTPVGVTITSLKANWDMYESTLVKVDDLKFGTEAGGVFKENTNYTLEDEAANSIVLRVSYANADLLGTTIPVKSSIVGFANVFDGTFQIIPRSSTDIAAVSTAIPEVEKKVVMISPNPMGDELRVSSEQVIESIAVYSSVGLLVKEARLGNRFIPTADLAKGMYIIQVTFEDGSVITQKVMKK